MNNYRCSQLLGNREQEFNPTSDDYYDFCAQYNNGTHLFDYKIYCPGEQPLSSLMCETRDGEEYKCFNTHCPTGQNSCCMSVTAWDLEEYGNPISNVINIGGIIAAAVGIPLAILVCCVCMIVIIVIIVAVVVCLVVKNATKENSQEMNVM